MNCAPGKIGTPSVASVGVASDEGRAGAAAAGAGAGGGCVAGRARCDGWPVAGRGNGCGVGVAGCCAPTRTPQRTPREQRTPRRRNQDFLRAAASLSLFLLCAPWSFLCVLVRIMPSIIDLRDFCRAHADWLLETTEALVALESPTTDK